MLSVDKDEQPASWTTNARIARQPLTFTRFCVAKSSPSVRRDNGGEPAPNKVANVDFLSTDRRTLGDSHAALESAANPATKEVMVITH